MVNCYISIYIDNIIVVFYINVMGGIYFLECNKIVCEIWIWCIQRNIWVIVILLLGKENVDVDREFRIFNDNIEWFFEENIFYSIVKIYGMLFIDFFVFRINRKVFCYVLWRLDFEV